MRSALVAVLLVVLPGPSSWFGGSIADAQPHGHRSTAAAAAQPWRPSIGLPLPQIGLPLPTIGLPLPSMGLPPPTVTTSSRIERFTGQRFKRPERSERFVHPLFLPVYGWPYPFFSETDVQQAPPAAPAPLVMTPTGSLRIELQPGVDAQVWVDGYYVGMLSDGVGQVTVDAGVHTVEVHDNAYEPLRIDVDVHADEMITYRGAMKTLAPPEHAPALPQPAAPVPTTIYVVPGCYVGNVPPREASLPAGCNASDAVAFPSQR